MGGFDPNMLLQYFAQMQRGPQSGQMQPQGFGFGQQPAPYTPPQIDTTPGFYNQAAQARASQPLMPIGGDRAATPAIPNMGAQPSQASQWAAQGLFGAQPGANGQQAGLGQAGLASLMKLFGL